MRKINYRISDPGKFEGEMFYVPYLWEEAIDGYWDNQIINGYTIEINDDLLGKLRNEFPQHSLQSLEDRFGDLLLLTESDQGFVYCSVITANEAFKILNSSWLDEE